ncbi:hypothetical protein QEN19_002742 [Hanseniaspora menglaensis]
MALSKNNPKSLSLSASVGTTKRSEYSITSPNLSMDNAEFLSTKGDNIIMQDIISAFASSFPIYTSPDTIELQTSGFPVQKLEVCSMDDIPNWKIKEISIEKGVIKNMNDLDLNSCVFRLLWDFSELYPIAATLGKNIENIKGGNEYADVPFFCISSKLGLHNDVYLVRVLDRTCFISFFMQLSFWTSMGKEGILERYTIEPKNEYSGSGTFDNFLGLKCKFLYEGQYNSSKSYWTDCELSISEKGFLNFNFEDESRDFVLSMQDMLEAEILTLDPSLAHDGEKILNIKILSELRKQYNLKDADWFDKNHIPRNISVKFSSFFNFLKVFFILKKNSIREILADNINSSNVLRLNHSINLNIIEAELNNMSLYSSSIYIEVCIYDNVFAKTNKVESTYGQLFWREEINLKCYSNLNSIMLKLRLENNDTVIGYVDISSYYLYNNEYKITGKELKLPIWQACSTNSNNKVIGELLVNLKHDWNFVLPSIQYYAVMDIFKEIDMENLVTYIYRDNRINNDAAVFEIGKTMFNILSFYGRENQFLNHCIEKEISDTIEVLMVREALKKNSPNHNNNHVFNSLFRGNSLVTKMFESHFNKLGNEYLFQIFQPILNKIYCDNLNLEMDPKKLRRNMKDLTSDEQLEAVLESNYHKLCEYLNEIWNSIYSTSMDLPQNIKLQLKFIRTNLELFSVHGLNEQELNLLVTNCISSFIFLRFFIPIILNPKLFNIMNESPNDSQRRTLTLVSKILLNISTQTLFEIKDPFLSRFNSFIKLKSVEVFAYYNKITEKVLDFTSKKFDFLVWKNDQSLINKFENDSLELQCTKFIDLVIENDLNSKNFINESKFLYDVQNLTYKKDIVIEMPKILQTRDLLNSPIDELSDFTFSKKINISDKTIYAIGDLYFENELKKEKITDFGQNMFELLGLKEEEQKGINKSISELDYGSEKPTYIGEQNMLSVELTQLFSECHILYSKKIRILKLFQQKEIYKKQLADYVKLVLLPNLVYDLDSKIITKESSENMAKTNRKQKRFAFQTVSMTELILGTYVLFGKKKKLSGPSLTSDKINYLKSSNSDENRNGSNKISRSFSKFFGKKKL